MINTKTQKNPDSKEEFSFSKTDMFSPKVVKIKPIFLLLFLFGLMAIFYIAILNPDFIFAIITGIALFAAGFLFSNLIYLNASGKREDTFNRMIINNSSDLFLIFKIGNGRFKYASPGLQKLLGYELTTIINQYDLSFVHPADRFDFYNILNKDFLRLNRNFNITLRMLKRDGSMIWIKIQGDVIVDASNEMENVVMSLRDVTKEVDEKIGLEQYQKSLEQAIENIVKEKDEDAIPQNIRITKISDSVNIKSINNQPDRKFQPVLTFKKLKLKI